MDYSDIAIRCLKTFLQAFLGILIPEICLILNSDVVVDWSFPAAVFAPLFCASLAAGLSAAWNFVEQYFDCRDNSEDI